ncbi:MAG: hypothetical protein ABSA12_10615 [Verrucomicrobiia bacterium]|jgi:Spy/CpxP family protein refolding chaperone
MKRFLALAVAAVVVMSAAVVYAGEGCCSGMSAKGASCGGDLFSKLNLTPDQKTKVNALMAECHKATSTSEFHQQFSSGLEKILTPDQLAQWKAMADKAPKSGGCPFMNSTAPKTDKT